MGRRTGRRDLRAQRRAAVRVLVRAGWSEGEVERLYGVALDVGEAEGVDLEALAGRLVALEEEWGWDDEERWDDDEDDGCRLAAHRGSCW